MVYTGIQINANQLDAYYVCLECTTILDTFDFFRKSCLKNDSIFHELWLAASVQETQDRIVETIDLSKQAEGTMDFDNEEHPAEEKENCNMIDIPTLLVVCQETPVVGECVQDSQQQTEEVMEEDDDFYSANYIKPSDKPFKDDFYFGDTTVYWSCYYWPPTRPEVKWRREPGKRKQHLCDVCGLMVTHIPTHAPVHKEQPTFACPYCPVKMKQKNGIMEHIQTVHLKVIKKTCHICGKSFIHRKTYVYHMRAHKDAGESFECKVCSKTFNRSVGLEVHVKKVHSLAKSVYPANN
uniref:C2H2-type domain-containing protein n=1 Tax=Anopheles maculatus TaxID=74869 RepID=A0A182T771_9DIPT